MAAPAPSVMKNLLVKPYSDGLSYYVNRLLGFDKQTYSLVLSRSEAINSSSVIEFDLPTSALVLKDTLQFHFELSSTATGGTNPGSLLPFAEAILDRVSVSLNGQTITSPNNVNMIYKLMYDLHNDMKHRRLYQRGDYLEAAVPASKTESSVPMYINNWVCPVVGSSDMTIVDTSIIGLTKLTLNLANNNVLAVHNADNTGVSWSINNVKVYVDTMNISDGRFFALRNQMLQKMPLEMRFTNHVLQQQTNSSGFTQTTKLSVATQSLDKVWAWHSPSSYNTTSVVNTDTGCSAYFDRITGTGGTPEIDTLNCFVNSISFPMFRLPFNHCHGHVVAQLDKAYDAVDDFHSRMFGTFTTNPESRLAAWEDSLFFFVNSFEYPSPAEERLISGFNTLNSNSFVEYQTIASSGSTANVAFLVCEMSSVLRIGANRSLQVVQ